MHRFKTFFEISRDMLCIADATHFLTINKSFNLTLGYTEEELLFTPFLDLVHSEDIESTKEAANSLQKIGIVQNFENRYRTKNGKYVWLSWTAESQDGLIYAIARDITEQKVRESKFVSINQELNQFCYVVSHDLKAPLRAIANLAKWLQEDFAEITSAQAKEWLVMMQNRVQHMNNLIDGLLEYSRVSRTNIDLELVDTYKVVIEMLDLLDKKQFIVNVSKDLPYIHANKVTLGQVFINLLDNAIKHHPRNNGKIDVYGSDVGNFYEFVVEDDGDGISAEFQKKLFVIFQTLKPKISSTGIGLALCKKIVESAGGKIWLESNEGNGAKFIFTWPK